MGVEDWSLDPDENTDINGTDISEGCPARNVNNAIREIMASIRATFDDISQMASATLAPLWNEEVDYETGGVARGSDGVLYSALATSGPSAAAGAKDPAQAGNEAWWEPLSPAPAVLSSPAGTRQADIAANTDFTVPLYRTGADSLLVYLDGILCLKGESYAETGTAGSASTAIQFLQTIPTTMDVVVRVN